MIIIYSIYSFMLDIIISRRKIYLFFHFMQRRLGGSLGDNRNHINLYD